MRSQIPLMPSRGTVVNGLNPEDVRAFYDTLPLAEAANLVPDFNVKSTGDNDGFDIKEMPEGTRVSFRDTSGTPSMVEEVALLKAAMMARDAGKAGIVIVSRRDVRYATNEVSNGVTMRSESNGFSTELTVQFVDPAALSPDLKAAPWRVIDVATVIDTLEPVYAPKKR